MKGAVKMMQTFFDIFETKAFLVAIIVVPIVAGIAIPLIYRRLELVQAFFTPERVDENEFDTDKQQQFIKKYNRRIEEKHLHIIENEYIKKRVLKNK